MSYTPMLLNTPGDLLTYSGTSTTDIAYAGTASILGGGQYGSVNLINRINDSNHGTFWQMTTATAWAARIDLGSPKAVGGWGYYVSGGGASRDLICSWSSDGTTFTSVDTTIVVGDNALYRRTLSPVTARYWKLEHTTGGNLYAAHSFELYPAVGSLVRLPIGSEGQSLKVVSGAPAWAT